MKNTAQGLAAARERLAAAERKFGRAPGSVALLAASKARGADTIREAVAAGQLDFGENYLQEASAKITVLADLPIRWHFIGPIQSRKARGIARDFHWVHSVDRARIARRLSDARPAGHPPLNVCIQVNISGEPTKSGVTPVELPGLVQAVAGLPGLQIRGLMALPAPAHGLEAQRRAFRELRELRDRIRRPDLPLETLSMGTTEDLEAAVAEGATIVRLGTAIFGARPAATPAPD